MICATLVNTQTHRLFWTGCTIGSANRAGWQRILFQRQEWKKFI